MRALTHRIQCTGRNSPTRNNEALAREGIDTMFQPPTITRLEKCNNEALAREGIDTQATVINLIQADFL